MIEISRKVEEPNGFFGSTGWQLTRNCNTLLLKTTDHGYHSNPCVVPHPVTLAPSLWHSEHAYKGLPQGKLFPPKHEAMFSPNPRGSGKVWMMLTSEYTFIIIYYANQTWVNREGFWWGFQQVQSNSCQCVFYELWMKNHAPSYKMASISALSKVRPDTFWFDLATSVSIGCGQSRPHFKEWFIVEGGLPQKLCGVNKTCYVLRGLWHYLRMGKIITFMKSTWNTQNTKQESNILWQTPFCMCQIVIMALKEYWNLHS